MDKTYVVLKEMKIETLEEKVNAKMAEGFQPVGGVFVLPIPPKNIEDSPSFVFIQAVAILPKPAYSGKKAAQSLPVVGTCPRCGKNLVYSKNGAVKCEDKECNAMFYMHYKRLLTLDEAKAVFGENKTIEIDHVVNQDGSERTCKIHYTGKVNETPKGRWLEIKEVQ